MYGCQCIYRGRDVTETNGLMTPARLSLQSFVAAAACSPVNGELFVAMKFNKRRPSDN
jgi:hypothetical protein